MANEPGTSKETNEQLQQGDLAKNLMYRGGKFVVFHTVTLITVVEILGCLISTKYLNMKAFKLRN
jgi:hypothetical protein